MFDFFRRRTAKEFIEEAKEKYSVPPMPEVTPPKEKEPEGKIYYRFGLTDNNRVAFSMGYTEISMNRQGCQQMIDQLTFYRDQLKEEEKDGVDSN